jgi:hypothetical protein
MVIDPQELVVSTTNRLQGLDGLAGQCAIHRSCPQDPWFVVGAKEWSAVMHCPFCRYIDSKVIDSRTTEDGTTIRRRRSCPECNRRFTTIETATLLVVKRSGATEPFSRDKVVSGVRKA